MRGFFKLNLLIRSCLMIMFLLISRAAHGVESVTLSPTDTEAEIVRKAAGVTPHPRQIAWQRRELNAFLHFGMNTFTNKEWGDGTESPELFNPADFDARQWMRVLKKSGFSQVIITAKHHDGFCLWPSAYTGHSVKNSPWRGGKGDVVREVADAAREAGLDFGFYLSPWDRHEPTFGTTAYNEHFLNQLRELLTNYGPVTEVWFDGACGDMDPRCKNLKYDWPPIFALVRELQPDAVISIYGPDARWIGNEAGENADTQWSVVPDGPGGPIPGDRASLIEAAQRGARLRWYPAQADTSIRPGWFYHKAEDYMVKPLDKLIDIYFDTVGGDAQLLLNIPPDAHGLIAKADIKRLKEFRRVLDSVFDINYAINAQTATDTGSNDKYIIDGDPDTFWSAADGAATAEIEFTLSTPATFDVVMLQEHIALGQRIESFTVEAYVDGNWREIGAGTTVGHKRLLRIAPVTASRVRVRITAARAAPTLVEFGLFSSAADQATGNDSDAFFPPLPEGKRFELVWSDEFEGDMLDATKWNVADGPRRDGFWSPGAVKLDGNGFLVIETFKDGDKFIDGEIDTQGKFEHTFGFYTARVRLQKQPGHWSAFWLFGDGICSKGNQGKDGSEIDIYEKIDQSDIVLHNLHWDCYCPILCTAGKKASVPGVAEGFHTFSVLWSPKKYVFYVDGKETWTTGAGGVCRVPLYVLLSDEIGTWAGDIKTAALPDSFAVDYVRVYDVVDE